MKKAFIPITHRPHVPGSRLHSLMGTCDNFNKATFQKPYRSAVIISAKEDIVPDYFLRDITYGKVARLYYDDLGVGWDFIFRNQELKLLTKNGVILPKSIYHRHPGVEKQHRFYEKHIAFFEVLDIWKGNLIGQKRDHHWNASKVYQLVTSIRNANKRCGGQIKVPRSFVVKGNIERLRSQFSGELIVKSCSNVRSLVVDGDEFSRWDALPLQYLPTLFQEKISGNDIRVHVCDEEMWGLEVKEKDTLDYRYAKKGSVAYAKIDMPEFLSLFCNFLNNFEQIRLTGIDFLRRGEDFFCLESNPGPGWSTFQHESRCLFSKTVAKKLKISEE